MNLTLSFLFFKAQMKARQWATQAVARGSKQCPSLTLLSLSFPPFNRLPSLGSHFPALILPPKKRPPPNLSHLLPRIHQCHVPSLLLWTPESIGSFLRHLIKIYLCFFSSLMSNICQASIDLNRKNINNSLILFKHGYGYTKELLQDLASVIWYSNIWEFKQCVYNSNSEHGIFLYQLRFKLNE